MYYLKIINIEPPNDIELDKNLFVSIKYNKSERITKTKLNYDNWNEVFLFEENPENISIFLMEEKDGYHSEIIEGGEVPINQNDLLEQTINCVEILHGFVDVKSFKETKSDEKDKEIDQNEIYYLKSVIDDKDNLIEETDTNLSILKDKYEELNDEVNNLKEQIEQINEKNRERDDLIIELADKFCKIKDILKD